MVGKQVYEDFSFGIVVGITMLALMLFTVTNATANCPVENKNCQLTTISSAAIAPIVSIQMII